MMGVSGSSQTGDGLVAARPCLLLAAISEALQLADEASEHVLAPHLWHMPIWQFHAAARHRHEICIEMSLTW
jgi:hypothetical protein